MTSDPRVRIVESSLDGSLRDRAKQDFIKRFRQAAIPVEPSELTEVDKKVITKLYIRLIGEAFDAGDLKTASTAISSLAKLHDIVC